jgi:hypothetical protein
MLLNAGDSNVGAPAPEILTVWQDASAERNAEAGGEPNQAIYHAELESEREREARTPQFAMIKAFKDTRTEASPMKAIELIGEIDEQHRLRASVPEELPAGPVRLIVLLSDEDETGAVWAHGVAREWAGELSDSRQDIYSLGDGQSVDAPR